MWKFWDYGVQYSTRSIIVVLLIPRGYHYR